MKKCSTLLAIAILALLFLTGHTSSLNFVKVIKKQTAKLLNKTKSLEYPKPAQRLAAGYCLQNLFQMYMIATLNLAINPKENAMVVTEIGMEKLLIKDKSIREKSIQKLKVLNHNELKQRINTAIHYYFDRKGSSNCEKLKEETAKFKPPKDGSDPQNLRFFKQFVKTRYSEEAVAPCLEAYTKIPQLLEARNLVGESQLGSLNLKIVEELGNASYCYMSR